MNSFSSEKITIEADSVQTPEKSVFHASGNVKIFQGEKTMLADEIFYYRDKNIIDANGNVIISENGDRIKCSKMKYDTEKQTGVFYDADAFMKPYQWFKAKKASKTGEDTYLLKGVRFSTCRGEEPDWSFTASEANIEIGGYLKAKHAAGWAKKVPVFYTPFFIYPVKTERETGFLIPKFGFSSDKGIFIQPKFFWNIDVDKDATFAVLTSSKEKPLYAMEIRMKPSTKTSVYNYIEYTNEHKEYPAENNGELRINSRSGRYFLYNRSDFHFSDKFYAKAKIDTVSDYKYLDDNEKFSLAKRINEDDKTFRSSLDFYYDTDFASFNFSTSDEMRYSLSSSYSKEHTYVNTVNIQKNITKYPVYFKYYGSYDRVRHTEYKYHYASKTEDSEDERYERYHLKIKAYKPFDLMLGTFTPSIEYMHTYWTGFSGDYNSARNETLSADTTTLETNDNHILRRIYTQQYTFRFKEIYKDYANFRHSIYNTAAYTHTPDIEQDRIFDYILDDKVEAERSYMFSIINYFKSKDWNLRLENSQKYNMALDDKRLEPFTSVLNYNYKSDINMGLKHEYNHYKNDTDYLSLSAKLKTPLIVFNAGYTFDKDTSEEENTSLSFSASYIGEKYDLFYSRTASGNSDRLNFDTSGSIDDTVKVIYKSDCWQFGISYTKKTDRVGISGGDDDDVEHIAMFTIGLKGLGEFDSSMGIGDTDENGDSK